MYSYELEGLRLYRGSRTTLSLDSLKLPKKGMLGILGPNGAGKSSLLKILAGLLSPSEGQVLFHGKALQSYSSRQLAQKIAWVPPELKLSFDLRVDELVMLGRFPWHQGLPSCEDKAICEEALVSLGLEDLSARYVNTLSSGERQKVQVARALASQVSCLILDEPLSHLDLKARFSLLDCLQGLSRERLVLICSHDHFLLPSFLQESLFFNDGLLALRQEGGLKSRQISDLFGLRGRLGNFDDEAGTS